MAESCLLINSKNVNILIFLDENIGENGEAGPSDLCSLLIHDEVNAVKSSNRPCITSTAQKSKG